MYIYYSVKKGRNPGIYIDYCEAVSQVENIKGASFKRFKAFDDAYKYLINSEPTTKNNKLKNKKIKSTEKMQPTIKQTEIDVKVEISNPLNIDKKGEYIAYVDGSFKAENNAFCSGIVLYSKDTTQEFSFSSNNKKGLKLGSVSGELEAALFAMEYVLSKKGKSLTIVYDFLGIRDYCTSPCEKQFVRSYQERYQEVVEKGLDIQFYKVKSKSDQFHNIAHKLASNAPICPVYI